MRYIIVYVPCVYAVACSSSIECDSESAQLLFASHALCRILPLPRPLGPPWSLFV
ncbi:hypothetical protein FG05_35344 [Fusarium graminearum]|nr:hypothetical protein FG05_35344 [Fusarium graminearum]